ncbi:hypothetical protein DFH08DRAFT_863204 [Mycena albidolilacea]|uniref:Uncharacterized protein n=1 Tax=Mycena albidolilacea TaxID=1033008 RepID=A0AAD7EUX9_9AGAR|nr:hypothetical protein DFH08DRAFT_863204 [Mycena albidolilacea]
MCVLSSPPSVFCFFSFVFGIFRSSFVVVCGLSLERGWRYSAGGRNVCVRVGDPSSDVMCGASGAGWVRVPRHPSHSSLLPSRGRRLPSSGLRRRPRHRRAPLSRGDSVGFGVLSHTALLVPVPGLFPSHVPCNLPNPPRPRSIPLPTSRFLASLVAYRLCATPAYPGPHCPARSFPSAAHYAHPLLLSACAWA